MADVGYVGLGVMGSSVVRRLLAAGHDVTVWNRTREKAEPLLDSGARWADSPREVAERTDVVFTMVTNTAAVRAVTDGADGILAGLRAGKTYVDMSTASPANTRDLAARVAETGAQMLDAPVSGTSITVDQGKATIMVGGDEDAFRRVEPVLRVLGTPEYVGENGQGLVLKLAINISLAVQMLAFSEGLLLAERDGIDAHRAAEIMTESAIGSPMLKARVPLVLDKPEETWFDVSLMHKDIRLALATAHERGVPLPSASVADKVLTEATEAGYEHHDIASMYEVLSKPGLDSAR